MLNIIKTIILGFILMFTVVAKAQQHKINEAYNYLIAKQLDSAKASIEIAVTNLETAKDTKAWYIRAFVYKTIFNEKERSNINSPARIESLESFKKIRSLNCTNEEEQQALSGIKYLTATIYNNIGDNLDTINYNTAIALFEKFKEYYSIVDTIKANIENKEIEFLLALASTYTEKYKNNQSKIEFFNLTILTYNKILKVDPNNLSANYNMGIIYYNKAVDIIKQQDYDLDIVALSDIQDNSIVLFKQSLPFMEKANKIGPNRKETLLGLSGIYFGLNEFEKSNLFKQQVKELEFKK